MMVGEFIVNLIVEEDETQVLAETCVRCGESSEYREMILENFHCWRGYCWRWCFTGRVKSRDCVLVWLYL